MPSSDVSMVAKNGRRDHFATYLEMLGAVADESRLHFRPKRFLTRAVDPANVAQVQLELSSEAFESYDTENETVGINVSRLEEVVCVEDQDGVGQPGEFVGETVTIRHHAEYRKLLAQIGAVEYTNALLDPAAIREEPEIPDLSLDVTIQMDVARLKALVAYADSVSDHLRLGYDLAEEKFYANAEGSTDDMNYRVHRSDLPAASATGDADSIFSLDYLRMFVDAIPDGTLVTLSIGEEFPMALEFPFAAAPEEETHYGQATYMIAPRIAGGDDE